MDAVDTDDGDDEGGGADDGGDDDNPRRSDTSDDNDGWCDFAAGNCSSALRKFPYEWTLSFHRLR